MNCGVWKSRLFDDLHFAFGDCGEEFGSVGFINDSAIQNNHNAGIGFGADKPAKTLLEFDNGRGKLVIEKGIAAFLFYLFESAGKQRLVRHGKWKTNNNHIG